MADVLDLAVDTGDSKKKLDELQKGLTDVGKSATKATPSLDDVNDTVQDTSKNLPKYTKGLDSASKALLNTTKSLKSLIPNVFSLKSALVGTVGALGVKNFVEFGAEIDRQKSILRAFAQTTQSSTEEITGLLEESKRLGAETAYTEKQVLKATNNLLALGSSAKEATEQLQSVVYLAGASGSQMDSVAESLKAVQESFGLTSETIANQFAGAHTTSAANVTRLTEALKSSGAVAAQLNVPFEDLVATLSLVISKGQDASTVGRSLKNILEKLTKESGPTAQALRELGVPVESFRNAAGDLLPLSEVFKKLNEALKDLGGTAEKAAILGEVFDLESKVAATILVESVEKAGRSIDDYKARISAAADVQKLYADITGDLKGNIAELSAALQSKLLTVYDGLSDKIQNVVEKTTDFIRLIDDEKLQDAFVSASNAVIYFSISVIKSLSSIIDLMDDIEISADNVSEGISSVLSVVGVVPVEEKISSLRNEISALEKDIQEGPGIWDSLFSGNVFDEIAGRAGGVQGAQLLQLQALREELEDLEKSSGKSSDSVSGKVQSASQIMIEFLESLITKTEETTEATKELVKSQQKLADVSPKVSPSAQAPSAIQDTVVPFSIPQIDVSILDIDAAVEAYKENLLKLAAFEKEQAEKRKLYNDAVSQSEAASDALKARASASFIDQLIAMTLDMSGFSDAVGLSIESINNLSGRISQGIAGAGASASRGVSAVQAFGEASDPISGAIAAGTEIVLSNEKVKESLDKLFEVVFDLIDPIVEVLVPVLDSLIEVVKPFVPVITELVNVLMPLASAIARLVEALGGAVGGAVQEAGKLFGMDLNESAQDRAEAELTDQINDFLDGVYAGFADDTEKRLYSIQSQFDEQIKNIKASDAGKQVRSKLKESTRIANAVALAAEGFFEEARAMAQTAASGGDAAADTFERAMKKVRSAQIDFGNALVEDAVELINTSGLSEYEKDLREITKRRAEERAQLEGMDPDLKAHYEGLINQAEALEVVAVKTARLEEAMQILADSLEDLAVVDFDLKLLELENFGDDLASQTEILRLNAHKTSEDILAASREMTDAAIAAAKNKGDLVEAAQIHQDQLDRERRIIAAYEQNLAIQVDQLAASFDQAEQELRDAATRALEPIQSVLDTEALGEAQTRIIEGIEVSESAAAEIESRYESLASAAIEAARATADYAGASQDEAIQLKANAAERIELAALVQDEIDKISELAEARRSGLASMEKDIQNTEFDLGVSGLSTAGKAIAEISKSYSDFIQNAHDETLGLLLTSEQAVRVAESRRQEISSAISEAFDPFLESIDEFRDKLNVFRGELAGGRTISLEELQAKLNFLQSLGDEGILNESGLRARKDLMEDIYAGAVELAGIQEAADQEHIDAILRMRTLSQSLSDQIVTLSLSEFNVETPEEKLKIAEEQFQRLRDAAFESAASGAAANDAAITEFQAFAEEYLTASQNVYKSGQGHIENFTRVTSELSSLSDIMSENADNLEASTESTRDALNNILDTLDMVAEDLNGKVNDAMATLLDISINFGGEGITTVGGVPVFETTLGIVATVSRELEGVELISDSGQVQMNIIAEINRLAEDGMVSGESVIASYNLLADINRSVEGGTLSGEDATGSLTILGNILKKVGDQEVGDVHEEILTLQASLQGSLNGTPIDFNGTSAAVDLDITAGADFETSNSYLENIDRALNTASGRNLLQVAEWTRGYTRDAKESLAEFLPSMLEHLGSNLDSSVNQESLLSQILGKITLVADHSSEIKGSVRDTSIYSNEIKNLSQKIKDQAGFVNYNTGDRGHMIGGLNRVHDTVEILTRANESNPIWERLHKIKRELGTGGLISGPSHSQGGVDVNLEGGEYVIPKAVVSDLGVPFFDALRDGNAPSGDVQTRVLRVQTPSTSRDNSAPLLMAVNQKLDRLTRVLEEKQMSVDVSVEGLDDFVDTRISNNNQAIKNRLSRQSGSLAKAF